MKATDEQIRNRLNTLLSDLLDANDNAAIGAATVDLDQSRVGRLSRMDALQNQAISQSAQVNRQKSIIETKAAIARLERGEYGLCEECEEPINPRRLEHNPAARHCIDCAENAENH